MITRRRRVLSLCVALFAVHASALPVPPCGGDCNGDGEVTVDEVITGVNIALGLIPVTACSALDDDANGDVTVDELVGAISNALDGCPAPSPTPAVTATSPPAASETPSATATASATPTATAPPDIPTPEPVPTLGSVLRVWLQEGNYLQWPAESARHPSSGPHFGGVRTFLNPTVFASLQAGLPSHPQGSALVKELYGSGARVQGWAVMVKVQADSDGGNGWYWFERFGTSGFADGLGEPGCTGCHARGNDYVRIPFPLQ